MHAMICQKVVAVALKSVLDLHMYMYIYIYMYIYAHNSTLQLGLHTLVLTPALSIFIS